MNFLSKLGLSEMPEQKEAQLFSVYGKDGCVIFAIERDGTVVGEVKDTSEAAQIFFQYLQELIKLPDQEQNK